MIPSATVERSNESCGYGRKQPCRTHASIVRTARSRRCSALCRAPHDRRSVGAELPDHAQDQCRRRRSRRRTWCTPRPMSRRRSASSPSAASTPTSSSSRAASPQTANVAVGAGLRHHQRQRRAVGRGMKVQQIWGLAPRMPQAYMVPEGITEPEQTQGQAAVRDRRRRRRLQLAHGPRGAALAGLDVDDAQFIPSPTAGRLPGLIAGQVDARGAASGGRVPGAAAEADAESAGAARRPDAATTCSTPTARRSPGSSATVRCCATPSRR